MKRLLNIAFYSIFTFLLSFGLCCIWMIQSTSGLHCLIRLLPKVVPGTLHIREASGALNHHFHLSGLTYSDKNLSIKLQDLNMDWQFSQYFQTMTINYLHLSGLEWKESTLHPQVESPPSPLPYWLPHQWHIHCFELTGSYYQSHRLPDITAQAEIKRVGNTFHLDTISADALAGHLHLNGDLTLFPFLQWQLALNSQAIHLNTLLKNEKGHFNLQMTTQGEIQSAHAQIKAHLISLTGILNNIPLKGQGLFVRQDQHYQLSDIELLSGENHLQLNLNMGHQLDGKWQVNFNHINSLFPDSKGSLLSHGHVSGTPQAPHVEGEITAKNIFLDPFQFSLQHLKANLMLKRLWEGNFQWDLQNARYKDSVINHASGNLKGNLTDHQGTLVLEAGKNRLKLQGQGHWNAPQWQMRLKQWEMSGPLVGQWHLKPGAQIFVRKSYLALQDFYWRTDAGHFELQGQWRENQGWWFTQKGQLALPPLNIVLQKIYLHAEGNSQQQIKYEGHFSSEKGHLQLIGTADLNPTQPKLQLAMNGNQFLAIHTNDYQIWVSPDLHLKKQGSRIQVWGTLAIPEAKIQLPDFRQNTVVLSKDVVVVDKPQQIDTTAQYLQQFYSNISVILGNKVQISAEGLNAKLTGKVTLQDTPTHPAIGNGNLLIKKGQYQIYGQTLQIHNGRLIYHGNPVTNPELQLQATKQVTAANTSSSPNNLMGSTLPSTGAQTSAPAIISNFNATLPLTVGVNINGSVEDPQLTLFASPLALSQTDILAYLIFGHPADQLSPSDASILLNAASGMKAGTGQIEQLTREIQQISGLDKISVESTSYVNPSSAALKQNTSLVLSKTLSPRLYVSYSLGLLEAVNVLTVKYLLTKQWSLQSTNSSFASGVDLFYNIERN